MLINPGKAPEALKVAVGGAVVVTKAGRRQNLNRIDPFGDYAAYGVFALCALYGLGLSPLASAAVLPDDKVEVLYHHYAETDQDINGPAVLVQKKLNEKYSFSYSHLVDRVSGASIDVRSYASAYVEKRTENSFSATHLFPKGTVTGGFRHSSENDFVGKSVFWQVSQETFGGMTTVNLGFSRAWDDISRRGDDDFQATADRWHYRLGVSQVLTPSLVSSVALEAITDEGFLNNPYRLVRYRDDTLAEGVGWIREEYPDTRTSYALSIFAKQYVSVPGAVGVHYRYFTDSWAVSAHQIGLQYNQPWRSVWEFEARLRWYTQTGAEFFSDLFPFGSQFGEEQPALRSQNFQARDKELADLTSITFGGGVSYTFKQWENNWAKDLQMHFFLDFLQIDYDNFRECCRETGLAPGQEPLYKLDATIFRFFITLKI